MIRLKFSDTVVVDSYKVSKTEVVKPLCSNSISISRHLIVICTYVKVSEVEEEEEENGKWKRGNKSRA